MRQTTRILVVDDDPGLREVMRRALLNRLPGACVYALPSGRQVLEIAGLWRPHLIVMDWVLGRGPTGVRLCRELKSRPLLRHVSILVVSGQHARELDGLKGVASGADAFLAKPFSIDRLTLYAKALLRKNSVLKGPGDDVLLVGRWLMSRQNRRLVSGGSGAQRLPKTLFELLWILAKHYPRAVPVTHLVRHVWKNQVRDSQAAVAVLRLKRRLNRECGTVESTPIGYRLVPTL